MNYAYALIMSSCPPLPCLLLMPAVFYLYNKKFTRNNNHKFRRAIDQSYIRTHLNCRCAVETSFLSRAHTKRPRFGREKGKN
jgi:hypothetical protein